MVHKFAYRYPALIFEFTTFLVKKQLFFEHVFLGNFAQKQFRDELGFTSVDATFDMFDFGFPKRRLQKKVCVKYENFPKICE